MLTLWKKVALIFILLIIILFGFLSNLIFFWGKYIEYVFVLAISAVGIIVIIVGTITYTINLKKNSNSGFMNNWLYLQEERKRQKRFLPLLYLLMLFNIAFLLWLGRYAFDTTTLMSKDLPYVISRNYTKIECYVKSNGHSYQRGMGHIQYITAINKKDNTYVFINFEHDYKKIDEYSNYIIWYLPNTKLGVRAEKIS